jgi:hypothetical protein
VVFMIISSPVLIHPSFLIQIFAFSGVVFAALWYFWPWLEKGQVRDLSFECRGMALPSTKANEICKTIAEHIADFDFTNKRYGHFYILSEILTLFTLMATFAYYAWLLDITKCYDYLDAIKYHRFRETDSHLLLLFPREYECPYLVAEERAIEENYGKYFKHIKCKVTYQQLNETFHLLALVISLIVMILYVVNLIYTIVMVAQIQNLAKSPSDRQIQKLKDMTLAKKIVLLMLHYNMDALTHLTLIHNILNANNLSQYKSLRKSNKKINKITEPNNTTSDNNGDNKMSKIFTEVLMSGNDTESDNSKEF